MNILKLERSLGACHERFDGPDPQGALNSLAFQQTSTLLRTTKTILVMCDLTSLAACFHEAMLVAYFNERGELEALSKLLCTGDCQGLLQPTVQTDRILFLLVRSLLFDSRGLQVAEIHAPEDLGVVLGQQGLE